MNFIESIQDYGLELLGRYYSKYRGVVVDNKDAVANRAKEVIDIDFIVSPINKCRLFRYMVKNAL